MLLAGGPVFQVPYKLNNVHLSTERKRTTNTKREMLIVYKKW